MNLVGKLLVVLIVMMSVAFMAFSVAVYSTHKNWMALTMEYQTKLLAQQKDNKAVAAEKDKIEEEAIRVKKDLENRIGNLETKRAALQGSVDMLTGDVTKLTTEKAQQLAALTTAQTTLDAKLKQVDALRQDIATAQQERDKNLEDVKTLTQDLNNATNDLTLLKEAQLRLTGQMAHAKILLERQGISPEAPVDGVPPKVDGVVLAIGRDNLIEISLGSDDGLRRNNTLEVFRGAQYKGRVVIKQTAPDKSVAEIIPGFQKAKIERDDRVATRFN